MDEEHLKQILKTRAERAIPDTLDLREVIMNQIQRETPRIPKRAVGLRRLSIAAALCIALITTAYVVAQDLTTPDAGVRAVENEIVQLNQNHPLNVNEPLNKLEVILDYAYADSNRIAIGYRVQGETTPGTKIVIFTNPTLTDVSGRQYPWVPATGQQVTEITPGTDTESFLHGGIMSFNSAVIGDAPTTLDLRLRVEVAYTTEAIRASDPYGMIPAGETTFTMNIPYNPGSALSLAQESVGKDMKVRLNRVVVSPSLTRLEICTDESVFGGDSWMSWTAVLNVSVNSEKIISSQPFGITGSNGAFLEPGARCHAVVITEALAARSGAWELSIETFHNPESAQTLTGPWSFTFDLK